MNERLKEEIQIYDTYLETNGLTASLSAIAEHFYNLALEDVKTFCKNEREVIFDLAAKGNDTKFHFGQANGIKGIMDFIDHLIK